MPSEVTQETAISYQPPLCLCVMVFLSPAFKIPAWDHVSLNFR